MFTDWLDTGPLDYSGLAGAFTPWARNPGSDAQAKGEEIIGFRDYIANTWGKIRGYSRGYIGVI